MRRNSLLVPIIYLVTYLSNALFAQNSENNVADLSLEQMLNQPISTAAKYEQTISQAPASVTIVTSDDIKRHGYRSLDEIFKRIRGFYVSCDRSYSYIGVRGFGRPTDYNNRILLLVDGHTLNENVYGSAAVGTDFGLDLEVIERIEVVRGPGSVLYGTNAMFAVVNVITKTGKAMDAMKLSAEVGSFGRRRGTATWGKEFESGTDLFVSGSLAEVEGQDLYFQEYDDPATNNGVAEDLDWDEFYGLLAAVRHNEFTLRAMISSREKGIPTGAWEATFNAPGAKLLDHRRFIELKYEHALAANKNLMARAYADHYHYAGDVPSFGTVASDASDGNWLGSELQFRWDARSYNRLTVGTEMQKHIDADYRLWDSNTTYFDQNFPFTVYSLYAQDEYQPVENLSLTFGLRRDENSTTKGSTTPRGALVLYPTKSSTVKFLYGHAFRAPNVYETSYEDQLLGYKSNHNLKPESIRTGEAVWEQRLWGTLLGVASVYHYEVNGLIEQAVDRTDSTMQFRNLNRVTARGVELDIEARFKTGLHGRISYAAQNAKDAATQRKLTNSPTHIVQIGLSYPFSKYLELATDMQYESGRITTKRTKTRPYLLSSLNLKTRRSFSDRLSGSLLINNVFDIEYATPAGFEHKQAAIIQDGRNFTLRVRYQL